MMQIDHEPEKRYCCPPRQKESGQFVPRGFASRENNIERNTRSQPRPIYGSTLADISIFPPVQPKPAGEATSGQEHADGAFSQRRWGLNAPRFETVQAKPEPNRTGMPDRLKAGIESLSGIDMSDVRMHANSPKPARLNALAYTQGNQIYMGPGQERHLAHEAWHAVQQKQGRVRATGEMKGISMNDEAGLEAEANAIGLRAGQLQPGLKTNFAPRSRISMASVFQHQVAQRVRDVWNREWFAHPEVYMTNTFGAVTIKEDTGSGGILDKPMQQLVLLLARPTPRATFAAQMRKRGDIGNQIATNLEIKVFDRDTAFTWVKENSLRIANLEPEVLSYYHEFTGAQSHTFHKDHGYVILTEDALRRKGLSSKPEITARKNVANGPWEMGWIRGHWGVRNNKHRFIEHVHVDKERAEQYRIDIYNTNNANDGQKAEMHNIDSTKGFSSQNNGPQEEAIKDIEISAHRLAWEEYKRTLPPEPDWTTM